MRSVGAEGHVDAECAQTRIYLKKPTQLDTSVSQH